MLLSLFVVAAQAQQQNLGWVFVTDDSGPDDFQAQSDMNSMGFNKDNVEYAEVMWTWDDTVYSGKNSGDGCSLWDLNKNGKADFALCVRINTDATTGQVAQTLTQLFDCRDTQALNCPTDSQQGYVDASNHTRMYPTATGSGPQLKSYCWIDFMKDPFASNSSHQALATNSTHDARAWCRIYYDEMKQGAYPNSVIQPGDPQLINVCSYPSSSPTSNFKDCVVAPDTGFLVINKWTNQPKCPTYTGFGAECGLEGAEVTCTLYNCTGVNLTNWNFNIVGSTTKNATVRGWGWTPLLPMPAGTYNVNEGTLPSGWIQVGFRCADNQTNPNAVVVSSGQTLVCYFVNYEGNLSTFVQTYGNVTNSSFGNLTLDQYVPPRTFAPTPVAAPTASCPPEMPPMFTSCIDLDFSGSCSAKCLGVVATMQAAFASQTPAFEDVCLSNYNSFALSFTSATMATISQRINAVPQESLCSNGGPLPAANSASKLSSNTVFLLASLLTLFF